MPVGCILVAKKDQTSLRICTVRSNSSLFAQIMNLPFESTAIWLDFSVRPKDVDGITNNVDPDQSNPLGPNLPQYLELIR